jgi:signal transduction histidine kinase
MHADLGKVRQILLNLLDNANKFTKDGVVMLTVVRENGRQETGNRRQETGESLVTDTWSLVPPISLSPHLIFTVSDTGIGMTEEQRSQLFQAFSQADPSTTRKYGGTGLGLVITQKFCQMMGGKIFVTSQSGVGTTFSVVLPENVSS